MLSDKPIGMMRLGVVQTFRKSWETACNYTDIKVEAGEYPAFVDSQLPYIMWVRLSGVIVDECYTNRLFWSVSTHRNDPDRRGEPIEHFLSYYDFQLKGNPDYRKI